MKCLVVTTHPLSKSLCGHLTEHVVHKLISMNHEVVIEDLYAEQFQPALTVAERESYYRTSYDASNIAREVKRLQEADALVLLFPTWWFSFPAILKGWFDRVWGPGIAYDHASDLGAITPRLSKLRKVLVVTTLGAPWWVDRVVMRQPVKRVVKMALLSACTKQSKLKFLSFYNSEKLSAERLSRFKRQIDRALNVWRE